MITVYFVSGKDSVKRIVGFLFYFWAISGIPVCQFAIVSDLIGVQ